MVAFWDFQPGNPGFPQVLQGIFTSTLNVLEVLTVLHAPIFYNVPTFQKFKVQKVLDVLEDLESKNSSTRSERSTSSRSANSQCSEIVSVLNALNVLNRLNNLKQSKFSKFEKNLNVKRGSQRVVGGKELLAVRSASSLLRKWFIHMSFFTRVHLSSALSASRSPKIRIPPTTRPASFSEL